MLFNSKPNLTGKKTNYSANRLHLLCGCSIYKSPPATDNMILWLDASQGVNNGIVWDGDGIHTWSDQSGNNNNFTQTTGGLQPTYKENSIGNLPSVEFTANSLLGFTGNLFSTTDPSFFTMYIVIQYKDGNGPTGNSRRNTIVLGAAGFNTLPVLPSQTIGLRGAISTTTPYNEAIAYQFRNSIMNIFNPADLNPHYISILSHGEIYGDGNQIIAGPGVALEITGNKNYIGAWNNSYCDAYISEFIVYNEKHTNIKRRAMETYLKNKYTL